MYYIQNYPHVFVVQNHKEKRTTSIAPITLWSLPGSYNDKKDSQYQYHHIPSMSMRLYTISSQLQLCWVLRWKTRIYAMFNGDVTNSSQRDPPNNMGQ